MAGDPTVPDEDTPTTLSNGRYDSFVLRVFSREPDGAVVHGEITHVATRRKHHFTELDSATAFILAQVGAHPAAIDESPEVQPGCATSGGGTGDSA